MLLDKIIRVMETPRKVLEDVEKEIYDLRMKIEKLEKAGKSSLPDALDVEFEKLVDYLYFRLKQLIKYRDCDKDNTYDI